MNLKKGVAKYRGEERWIEKAGARVWRGRDGHGGAEEECRGAWRVKVGPKEA